MRQLKATNPKIKEIADYIVKALSSREFIIHRYDAYSTNSVYLKLDYGVCNSIRISDHSGKEHLCYRYNIIIGGEENIVEEEYIRYFYNEKSVNSLLNQILFDKMAKLEKYNKLGYKNFMIKNKLKSSDNKGFWHNAKLVTNDIDESIPVQKTGNLGIKATVVSKPILMSSDNQLTQMSDGSFAVGPKEVLDLYDKSIQNQINIEESSKFHTGEEVTVTASYDMLVAYYINSGESELKAKQHAMAIKGMVGYDIGEVIGVNKFTDGIFYTLELPLIPVEMLPEDFISSISSHH